MVSEETSEFMENNIFTILLLIRNTIIGTVSFGLLIGAILFIHYLYRLSCLPKTSRQYRQLSYHMQSQTLLRYYITIACLIILNILFYGFFELGKTCTHIGIFIWIIYGLYLLIKKMTTRTHI